jgi:hypothetical protein
MRTLLSNLGIQLRLSCPYTSQQNGKAERVLRTINDCLRTMLLHSAAPLTFWAEALQTATYLLNRRPCRATGAATPHELLFGVPPSYDELRVFGCRCFPNLLATSSHKLAARSTTCVFLGYPSDHRGYRCYDVSSGRVITSCHVVFDEQVFPFRDALPPISTNMRAAPSEPPTPTRDVSSPCMPAPTSSSPRLAAELTPPPSPAPVHPVAPSWPPPMSTPPLPLAASSPTDAAPAPSTSTQVPSSPAPQAATTTLGHHMVTRARAGVHKPNPKYALATSTASISPVPRSVRSALQDPNWYAAMQSEFDALQDNQTWCLVPRPPGARVITGKWVFKHKLNLDGSLARYKARWVVRGFNQ